MALFSHGLEVMKALSAALVGDRVVAPQRGPRPGVHSLWLCDLTWKRDFADLMKVMTWRWGVYPGLSRALRVTTGPYKGETTGPESEQEAEVWAMSQGLRGGGSHQDMEAARTGSPRRLWGRVVLPTFGFSYMRPILDLWPQNCVIVNLCCFVTLSWW